MVTDSTSQPLDNPAPCWCLSAGYAGMKSQVTGLARAVGLQYTSKKTRLASPWKWLPLEAIPRRPSAITCPEIITGTPPRLVISCGRHAVIPALTLKRQYGDRVFAVHIQDPATNPAPFDMVVVPKHDSTRGPNVYLCDGAIHYVTRERLAQAKTDPVRDELTSGTDSVVTVLVGGPNKYYHFTNQHLEPFYEKLKRLGRHHRLAILTSSRTPDAVYEHLYHEFSDEHYVWDRTSSNPYFTALAIASHLVVTGDSVSMVTEAAFTGRPVLVEHLTEKRRARRFRRFHTQFQEAGFVRPFDGVLEDWAYEPPNHTAEVARIIQERIGCHDTPARSSKHDRAA
jgi:hypothetical protein